MVASNQATPIILAVILIAAPASADDWPQWLGPERNGVSAEMNLMRDWPDAGPEVLWRVPLGKGFSAISAAAGRLFTMYADPHGEFAVCLDAASGEKLWRVRTGDYYKETQGGDGPRSTPTVDGDAVYVLGAEGLLFALEADSGHEIWQKDLAEEFGSEVPRWGFSTSPLVEGELLLLEAGGVEGNFLVNMVIDRSANATAVALDKKTGHAVLECPGRQNELLLTDRLHGRRQPPGSVPQRLRSSGTLCRRRQRTVALSLEDSVGTSVPLPLSSCRPTGSSSPPRGRELWCASVRAALRRSGETAR